MIRKTVIITGASGGIGSACAKKFAQNGYNVALCYFKHKPVALEKELKNFGVETKSYCINLADAKEISKVFNNIFKDFEYIDVLVNCAGIIQPKKMLIDNTIEDVDYVLDVNLRGTLNCIREALPRFIKIKRGNIVNIASIHGLQGSSCESVYSASKAGIIGLTQALSGEVGQFGIRINAVAPGFIETEMTTSFTKKEKENIACRTPLGRLGQSDDVANAVYFLASDESAFITGITLPVTGGVVKF